ncbi:NAD-dependent epimerase/dehydratase [Daedaleopsis nitida]|nr:NAD-dependent epimerase/dehydratase [Daedaleopsis nitida]
MLLLDTNHLILVTGGNGFLGGHVARRLRREGYHRLRIVDISPRPLSDAPPTGEVMIGNLCDPAFCTRAVSSVDVVLHFAANMGGMGTIHAGNDFVIYRENHAMTTNLLAASVEAGVQGFFYASSACVYPESLQTQGTDDVSLSEDDAWKELPPHPQGLYGLEKLASELVLAQYASRLQIRIARFHNVYGPWGSWSGGREKVPAAFLRKAIGAKLAGDGAERFEIWGDGTQKRSFCFVDDAVEGVIRLLKSDCAQPVNIGSDRSVSIQQLADIAIAAAGLESHTVSFACRADQPIGVASRNSNNTRVHSTLGWAPIVTLEEGMQRTGEWIHDQIVSISATMDAVEKANFLRALQTSDKVDLANDAITFAILLPITSRGSNSPQNCLENLARFARSLAATTADDVSRLGERYRVHIYLAIDHDDEFFWRATGPNAAEALLRAEGFGNVFTLEPSIRPRGHVCALWRDCARKAYEAHACDYYILMGDDVVVQDPSWMSAIHRAFVDLSEHKGVPHGIGCVAFTDTSFEGMATFPVVHRTHMDIFDGDVIPDCFTNQDGDPFLFQLYRRWGCSQAIPSRIHNTVGGSGAARYDKLHADGWTIQPLDQATTTVATWLQRRFPALHSPRKLSLDVIIPCYRVNMAYLDVFLALEPSPTCTVMFIIIVDDPLSPHIGDLMQKYGRRLDVRIRVNSQNLGASASRNRGLQESAAEWVCFLDDDVTPEKDILVEAEKAILAHPDAAGFVGNAYFPSADTVFTAAVHLAGVTFFWDIANKIPYDVPWGVTANLIARRNVLDGVTYNLQFPKTGGGEDIDYCRRKRAFSIAHGGKPFLAVPRVKVTHPWWNGGRRSYWRFYMWSKGDGGLIKLYPEHAYRDTSPNAAECLLGCCVMLLSVPFLTLIDFQLALHVFRVSCLLLAAVMMSNIAYDLVRHLIIHPERNADMKTTVKGAMWLVAIVEGTLIRMFSEWGRVVGLLERGEVGLLMTRFDWFCGVWGDGPRREETRNNVVRNALMMVIFAGFLEVCIR